MTGGAAVLVWEVAEEPDGTRVAAIRVDLVAVKAEAAAAAEVGTDKIKRRVGQRSKPSVSYADDRGFESRPCYFKNPLT